MPPARPAPRFRPRRKSICPCVSSWLISLICRDRTCIVSISYAFRRERNDRAFASLDAASGSPSLLGDLRALIGRPDRLISRPELHDAVRETLEDRRLSADHIATRTGQSRPDGYRCALRCSEDRAPDRRRVLRYRRAGAVVGAFAGARPDPAENPAGRRSPDRLSRRHRRAAASPAWSAGNRSRSRPARSSCSPMRDPHVMSSGAGMRAEPPTPT